MTIDWRYDKRGMQVAHSLLAAMALPDSDLVWDKATISCTVPADGLGDRCVKRPSGIVACAITVREDPCQASWTAHLQQVAVAGMAYALPAQATLRSE